MSIEKAKAHFLGRQGHKKLNCGQSIIYAFKEKFPIPENTIDRFKAFGRGKAPEGYCGSYYAAKVILENSHPDMLLLI